MDSLKQLESHSIYVQFKETFSLVEPQTRKIMKELFKDQLAYQIGLGLNSFSIDEDVNAIKLFNEKLKNYCKEKNISYLQYYEKLNELEKRGWIKVKREHKRPPNYFLTLNFARAVDIVKTVEEKFIKPVLKELRKIPEFKESENLEEALYGLMRLALD